MTTVEDLLDALLEDDADDLRRAFRELASTHAIDDINDSEEFAARLDQLFEELALIQESRERLTTSQTAAVQPGMRAARLNFHALNTHFIPIVVVCLCLPVLGMLARTSYVKSFTDEIFAGIRPQKSIESAAGTATKDDPPKLVDRVERIEAGPCGPQDCDSAERKDAAPEMVVSQDLKSQEIKSQDIKSQDIKAASAEPDPEMWIEPVESAERSYQDKGVAAYRAQNFSQALVYFDLAIQQNPTVSDGYIDRSIVHYRLGNVSRAFADIDRARRIDAAKGVLEDGSLRHDDFQ
jgi:tetratricopeptide (TPR) repeat protein